MIDAGPVVLSIAVLACFALAVGGGRLIYTGCDRTRGILMLVMALVLIGNVLIFALPAS